jgi:hypothetical protein
LIQPDFSIRAKSLICCKPSHKPPENLQTAQKYTNWQKLTKTAPVRQRV